MHAIVHATCVSCALCTTTCPEIFQIGEDGLAHGSQVPEELMDRAFTARDSCPVGAIDLKD